MAEAEQAALEDGPFSIGGYLKAQRKIRGIGLEELSVRTRIPLRSLVRLEDGAFDGDPDGFVRGFVRTVAAGLGLDPDDTLMRMLAEPAASKATRVRVGLPGRAWLALTVGIVAALAGAILLHAALWAGPSQRGSDIVIRQDPVRALAEADAASPTTPSKPADEATAEATGDLPDVSTPPR
jgi:cytoskeleton protein RodZ